MKFSKELIDQFFEMKIEMQGEAERLFDAFSSSNVCLTEANKAKSWLIASRSEALAPFKEVVRRSMDRSTMARSEKISSHIMLVASLSGSMLPAE